MSLADEIRTALQHKPNATSEQIAELCRSARDSNHVATNLSAFVTRGEAISTKNLSGPNTYALAPEFVAVRKGPKAGAKPARRPPPKKKTAKTKAPAAPRAPRTALAPIEQVPDTHVVALKANGGLFIMDRNDGAFTELPPSVTHQLRALFAQGTHAQ